MLLRRVSGSFGLSLVDQLVRFATGIVLARMLGVSGYGLYAYALSCVSILSVLALLGADRLLLREVPRTLELKEWGQMKGVLRYAFVRSLARSLLVGGAGAIAIYYWARWQVGHGSGLVIAMALVPCIAIMQIGIAGLRGLHHVLLGQVANKLWQPLLILGALLGVYLLAGPAIRPGTALLVNVFATACAALYAMVTLLARLPSEVRDAQATRYDPTWRKVGVVMFVSVLGTTVNAQMPTLMLGWFASEEAVGVYAVATRGLLPVTLVISTFSAALSSTLTQHYFAGRFGELQALLTRSARWQLALAAIPAAALFVYGDVFLAVFGRGFVAGENAMHWLLLGQLVNAATGSVGTLLMLSGHERQTVAGLGVGIAANAVLCAMLIPLHEHAGAAISFAASLSIWNVGLSVYAMRSLKLDPTAMGIRGLRHE